MKSLTRAGTAVVCRAILTLRAETAAKLASRSATCASPATVDWWPPPTTTTTRCRPALLRTARPVRFSHTRIHDMMCPHSRRLLFRPNLAPSLYFRNVSFRLRPSGLPPAIGPSWWIIPTHRSSNVFSNTRHAKTFRTFSYVHTYVTYEIEFPGSVIHRHAFNSILINQVFEVQLLDVIELWKICA